MPTASSPQVDPVLVALVGLFRTFMGLDADQVVIYNQNWRIPEDDRLYILISLTAAKPFGSSNPKRSDADRLIEAITVYTQETYTVNVFSSSNEALIRNWEIAASLNSTIGQQAQEEGGFEFSFQPLSVVDLSGVEGVSRLYRYANTINLLRTRTRESVIEYFDKFPGTPALIINP